MSARFGFLGAAILAAALAACGGGGGGTSGGPPPTAPPTPTPTASGATPTPIPSTTPAGVAFGSMMALPVAPGASYSGSISFPSGVGSATLSASIGVPGTTSELNSTGRSTPSARSRTATGAHIRPLTTGAPYTAAAYFTLTATSPVSLSGIPTITAAGYEAAFYNTQGFWVTLPQSGTITLATGASAYFAIYTASAGNPSTLPSPNPEGCVGVQPNATTRGAKPNVVGVQPITTGAAFSYTGTLTSTTVRATPCAIPTVSASASVSLAVNMTAGTGSLVNENSTENDAYATNTVTTTTVAVVEPTSTPAAQSFAELSETTSDEVGDSTVTTYATPLIYAIAAPLPFSGPITNGPPSTVVGTLADGTKTTRTYASGGYTETDTVPGGGTNTISVKSDGSGSYNIGPGSVVVNYSAPTSKSITLSVSTGASPQPLTVPAWFSPGATLYSDTTTDTSATAFPSQCSPSPNVAPTDDFARTISIIDPVLGYTETEIINSYVTANYAGSGKTVGPACVTISDVQKIYYDYNYDTPYVIYAAFASPAAPLQTNTISEAYWFSSTPTGYSKVRTMSTGAEGLNASIAAHASGIAFQRALERAQRIETLTRNIATRRLGGVK